MKYLLILFFVSVSTYSGFAQNNDTCRIYHNKQLLLQLNTVGGKDTPLLIIKKTWLQGKILFQINFKQVEKRTGWRRIFQLTDDVNNILLQKEFKYTEGTYVFNSTTTKSFSTKYKKLLLYSFQQPAENSLLSGIRIERYLLARLILQ